MTFIQISQDVSQMVWHYHLIKNFPQFVVIHTVKGFSEVKKAEVDFFFFLKLSCFFNDSTNVGNLISSSSVFHKSSLNIWNFVVHMLLKPGLENFEHFFASMWDECNCVVVWAFFGIVFLCDWNENWHFPVPWPLLCFPNLLAYLVLHFHSIISYNWYRSAGIPSLPLALFKWVFLRPTWLCTPGCLVLFEW